MKPIRPLARLGQSLLGLLVILAGLFFSISMCGENTHIPGAALGSLGGLVIGRRRRSEQLGVVTTAGGIAGGLLGMVMELVGTGSCAGILTALLGGAGVGFGSGLIGEAVFRPGVEAPSAR